MAAARVFLVVMAGGSGTRFWPKSTSKRPKQFLSFDWAGDPSKAKTLIQSTFARFSGIVPPSQQMVVTTEKLAALVREQTPQVQVLAEPAGRNTAPCVYWAAREIAKKDPDAVMLVMPADHYIPHEKAFRETIERAVNWAETHTDLVTLGVKPDRPETGYGYLQTGQSLGGEARRVDRFVEKPNLSTAEQYLREGIYLWNAGMFVWRVSTVLKAFDEFMPEMKKNWDQVGGDVMKAYPTLTATSIDYGVMEKAKNVVTFPLDCGWDDLGSWTSLESLAVRLGAQREFGVATGGEVIGIESKGNLVDAPGKLVTLLGVEDLIVVEAGGSILIAKKDRAQDIRKVVDAVKAQRPDLA